MIRNTPARGASDLAWFKSSYSSSSEDDSCVEVATTPATIHIRDSKVTVGPTTWAEFVSYTAGQSKELMSGGSVPLIGVLPSSDMRRHPRRLAQIRHLLLGGGG